MADTPQTRRIVRFGVFEVDLAAHQLRKNGLRVRLQDQPFQLLALLLARPGEVVTREELREKLWPADTFVEFDHSLNTAVKKIRKALGDSADGSRWVETVPRQGYRFLAPVEQIGEPANAASKAREHAETGAATLPAAEALHATNPRKRLVVAALLVLFGVAVAAIVGLLFRDPGAVQEPGRMRFTLNAPGLPQNMHIHNSAAVSPDGNYVAYRDAASSLWVHDLRLDERRKVADGQGPYFWSPDSSSIAFTHFWELRRVSVDGGSPLTLCKFPGGYLGGPGTWSPDGKSIVFASGPPDKLYEVPATGGQPELLLEPESAEAIRFAPYFLPTRSGDRILAFVEQTDAGSRIVVQNLETSQRYTLVEGAWPVYSPTGHILYQESVEQVAGPGGMWAVPFSLETMRVTGEPFSVASNGLRPSVAADGTLVYVEWDTTNQRQLVWRDRNGTKLGDIGQPQFEIHLPSLSPDGRYVGVEGVEEETGADVWLHEVGRPVKHRFTLDPRRDSRAVWSPDGRQVAFWSERDGKPDVYVRPVDLSSEAKLVLSQWGYQEPNDWSPNGKYLLCTGADTPYPGLQYLALEAEGGQNPIPFIEPRGPDEMIWWGTFSPDGRYVAYCSNESGQWDVYVQAFPGGGSKSKVSLDGGTQPRWAKNGKELFYVERDSLVAVAITTTPSFAIRTYTNLFTNEHLARPWPVPAYDVSRDGQKFVLIEPVGGSPPFRIRVEQNWFARFQ